MTTSVYRHLPGLVPTMRRLVQLNIWADNQGWHATVPQPWRPVIRWETVAPRWERPSMAPPLDLEPTGKLTELQVSPELIAAMSGVDMTAIAKHAASMEILKQP